MTIRHSRGPVGEAERAEPCQVRLFGPPAASWSGKAIHLPDRVFALLAYLASRPGQTAKRDGIAGVLFGDADPPRGGTALRQLLSRLRRLQEQSGLSFVALHGDLVGLSDGGVSIDLVAFLRVDPAPLIRGRNVDQLRSWLDLFRGDLLEDLKIDDRGFDEWLVRQREVATSRFLAAATEVLENVDIGDDGLLGLAARVRTIEPDSAAACVAELRIHLKGGRRSAARRVYDAHVRVLREEHGAGPSERVKTLARDNGLLPQRVPGLADALPTLSTIRLDRPERSSEKTPVSGCPRILILPPLVLEEKKAARRLAQVFIEDVTVGLSRYRSFTVLAYHTARIVAQGETQAERLMARGGADFVITSSLKPRSAGAAMSFRLTEFGRDEVISVSEVDWHQDRLTDVFAHLVERVVQVLVDAIESRVSISSTVSADATAYRLYLEGRQSLASIDLPNLRRAKRWFRDATSRMPTYAAPWFGLARATMMEWFVVGMPADSSLADVLVLSERGLAIDPSDWRGLREKALACLWLRRHDDCLSLFERALQEGPNDADLIADHADALAHCGDPEQGLQTFRRAFELNPLHPDYYTWIKGSVEFQMGRYADALDTMAPIRHNPATSRLMAACAGLAGRTEEAKAYAQTLREVYPTFQADDLWRISPNRRREDTAHFIQGLNAAGIR